jgi:hypothetical protein
MKTCPNCQSQYTDDTLQFCLQDGTRLQSGSEMKTASFGEQETVVSNRPSSQINTPRETSPTNWQPNQFPSNSNFQTPEKKSNTTAAVFLTAFLMLLFFSLVGIGGWLYFRGATPDDNGNLMLAKKKNNETTANTASTAPTDSSRSTPAATPFTRSSNADTTSTPIDSVQIQKDVSQRVDSWKTAGESLDLDKYMDNYAPKIDYYNKKGASIATVRSDKQKAFNQYSAIKVTISNLTVTPDASGERATAVFDKEWNFTGEESDSAGKVRQQLQLQKINGQWLITGEKDLKLYYKE